MSLVADGVGYEDVANPVASYEDIWAWEWAEDENSSHRSLVLDYAKGDNFASSDFTSVSNEEDVGFDLMRDWIEEELLLDILLEACFNA